MSSSNMAPPPLFKTPEEVIAESSMGHNDSAAQHVSHVPSSIDPHTPSIRANTATKQTAIPPPPTAIHQRPNRFVHPPAGVPPSLKTPTATYESSDQWAKNALSAITDDTLQQGGSNASTPDLDIPGSFPRSSGTTNEGPHVDLATAASTVASTVAETAKAVAGVAVPVVQSATQAALPVVQSAAGYVRDTGVPAAQNTAGSVRDNAVPAAQNAASTVGNTASSATGAVSSTASNAASSVYNAASNATGAVSSTASNAASAVSNTASNATGAVSHTASNTTGAISNTASGVTSTLHDYAASAGDAVKPYLPAAVGGILPSHPTSTDTKRTGVETLPGDAVARLPEETRTSAFPSHDDEGLTPLGKTGGAGPLPGSSREVGVALLPDERRGREEEGAVERASGGETHDTRPAAFHKEVAPKGTSFLNPTFNIQPILGTSQPLTSASGLPTKTAPEVSTHAPVVPPPHDKNTNRDKDKDEGWSAGTSVSGASEGASTKTLPGSKGNVSRSISGSSGTYDAPLGVGHHDPVNHHPRTHLGATLAGINTAREEKGYGPVDNARGHARAGNEVEGLAPALGSSVTGLGAPAPPAVPPKDRSDSDGATTGHEHGQRVETTTNTLVHAEPATARGRKHTPSASVDKGRSEGRRGVHGADSDNAGSTTDDAERMAADDQARHATAGVTRGTGLGATAPGLNMGHTAGVHSEVHPTYGADDASKASAASGQGQGQSYGHGHGQTGHYQTTSSSSHGRQKRNSTSSTGSSGEKKGFMSKIKGEVKVISGKIGRDEGKVEEGRRMMGRN